MKEIRIHGRGGQGSVVIAELLAIAAFKDGMYSQAFPYLGGGGERRGAPVQAFCRIDDEPIRLKFRINEPNHLIIQDASISEVVNVYQGLKKGSLVLVNSTRNPEQLGIASPDFRIFCFPALEIALDILKKPIINTIMIGAFAALTGGFKLDCLKEAINSKFPGELGVKNIEAMEAAYNIAKDKLCREV